MRELTSYLKLMVTAVLVFALPHIAVSKPSGIIEGRVTDTETGSPLVNVNIFLKGTGLGTTTDLQGRYSIAGVPAGKFEIVAQIVGYKEEKRVIELLPNQRMTLDFKLRQSAILLDEIVVTATKTTHLVSDAPIPTSVVTRKQIDKYNALDAGEAVKYLTGIRFNRSFSPMASDVFQIQGLPSRYTLVLLDGERIGGRYPLTQIPTDVVKKVEMVKGPSSVLYGSDAIGGVCNVITRALPRRHFFNTRFSYGSYEAKSLVLTHGGHFGKFGYLISACGNRTEGEEGKRNWYNMENIFGKLGWEKDRRNDWTIRGGYYHEDLSLREAKRFDVGLEGKIGLPDLSNLVVKGYRARSRDKTHVGGALEATVTDEERNRGELRWTGTLFERHLSSLGMEILYKKIEQRIEEGDELIDKSQHMESLYLQDEIIFKPVTLLVAGRLDHHSVWGTHFNPKLALLYKATNWLRLRASVGNAFKAPTSEQLYRRTWHPGGRGFWIKGNPNLEPETSTGYNLELEMQLKDVFHGKLSFFRHDLRDMIDGFWAEPYSVYSYQNIGKALTQGAEAEIKGSLFTENLAGTVKYTFLKTKDKETDKELTYRPHHRATAELGYSNRRFGLSLTLIEEYVGTRFKDWKNEEKLPHYFLTHVRVNQTLLKRLVLFLSINNLFGEKYLDMRFSEDSLTYKTGLTLKF